VSRDNMPRLNVSR